MGELIINDWNLYLKTSRNPYRIDISKLNIGRTNQKTNRANLKKSYLNGIQKKKI